jgi:hypothetical protein
MFLISLHKKEARFISNSLALLAAVSMTLKQLGSAGRNAVEPHGGSCLLHPIVTYYLRSHIRRLTRKCLSFAQSLSTCSCSNPKKEKRCYVFLTSTIPRIN